MRTITKTDLVSAAFATAILVAGGFAITEPANGADLIDTDQARYDTHNTVPEERRYDVTYRTINRLDALEAGQSAVGINQRLINEEVIIQHAMIEEQAAATGQTFDEVKARIDQEVAAAEQRFSALERLASLPTLDNPVAAAAAIDDNTQRITSLENDVDELRNDAAAWSSMAAAMDAGYLAAQERFSISGNAASIGGGSGAAVNAVARITGRLTFNASVATSSAGDVGGMIGARFGW